MPTPLSDVNIAIQLEVFARWWCRGILECVPISWRKMFGRNEIVVLQVDRTMLNQAIRNDNAITIIDHPNLDSPRGLIFVSDQLLYRITVQLPLTSTYDLNNIVRFEAQRRCPLPLDGIAIDQVVMERNLSQRTQIVELIFCRNTTIERAISFAHNQGTPVDGVCIAGSNGPIRLLNLTSAGRFHRWVSRHQEKWLLSIAQAIAALIPSVAVLCLGLLIINAFLLHTIEENRESVAQAENARQDYERVANLIKMMNKEVVVTPAFSQLNLVASLLPDSAHLSQVDIDEHIITITGDAREPSELLRIFSSSDLLVKPHFIGPLVRLDRQDLEQFSLSLEIR